MLTGGPVRRGAGRAKACRNLSLVLLRVFFVFVLRYFRNAHGSTLAMAAAACWTVSARRRRAPASRPMRSEMLVGTLDGLGGGDWRELLPGSILAGCNAARCGRRGMVAASGWMGRGGGGGGQALSCAGDGSGSRGGGAGVRPRTISCWESLMGGCWLTELSPALADTLVTMYRALPRASAECGVVFAESILEIQAPEGLASTGTFPTQVASNPARRRAHVGKWRSTWLDGQWS